MYIVVADDDDTSVISAGSLVTIRVHLKRIGLLVSVYMCTCVYRNMYVHVLYVMYMYMYTCNIFIEESYLHVHIHVVTCTTSMTLNEYSLQSHCLLSICTIVHPHPPKAWRPNYNREGILVHYHHLSISWLVLLT